MKKILGVIGLLFAFLAAAPVFAAENISSLTDSEVRQLLIERLDETETAPEEAFNPAKLAWRLQKNFSLVKEKAGQILGSYHELPALPGKWWERMNSGRDAGGFGQFAVAFVISLAAGVICAFFARRSMTRVWQKERVAASPPAHLFGRLLMEGAAAIILATIATAVFFVIASGDSRDRTLFFFFLSASVIVALVSGASRALFSLDAPDLRVPMMKDRDARRFHRAILGTVAFGAFGFFSCASFAALGISGPSHDLLLMLVGVITTILLTATIWISRHAIAGDILSGSEQPSTVRRLAAWCWPHMAVTLTPLMFIGLLINIFLGGLPLYGAAIFTVMLLILAPIGESALARSIIALEGSAQVVPTIIARISRIALLLIIVVLLATAWRVDLSFSGEGGIGASVFQALIQITAIVSVAYATWQVVRVFLDQKIASEDAEYALKNGVEAGMEGETGGPGKSRTRTLLPLLRRAALIVLSVLVVLVALASLGIETGPLLAGAGVVGLAIGFGSQTLVKDIVTGFFFLLEDAFRLGEYIDVGKVKGTVEQISVRSMKLRHHRGALNTVPFGSVDVIENYSRDWAIMKLRVRVPFETDLNKVRKLLKQVGNEMMKIEAIRDDFLQPFKAQGAVDVDDYGFVISTKFMSKPGTQFTIRRYAFQAMQDAFEANGIPFARPSVRVVADGESEGDAIAPPSSTPASDVAASLIQKNVREAKV